LKKIKKLIKTISIIITILITTITLLAIYNQIALKIEQKYIIPNGQIIKIENYKVHVYIEGNNNDKPILVFLAGAGTVSPVYDFKILYNKLSQNYKIVVIEKLGYGYSDIVAKERDLNTVVQEERTALIKAKLEGPYILIAHSMAGLEALYWAQNYPNEIASIIGLDMAVAQSYDEFDFSKLKQNQALGRASIKLGLTRIPGLYPLNTKSLTKQEINQQKLLMHRNAVNSVYLLEAEALYNNSIIVKNGPPISCPIIMFTSNGDEIGDFWISKQKQFANENNIELNSFDCGHYLHYYKSEEITESIKKFIKNNF